MAKSKKPYAASEYEFAEQLEKLAFLFESESDNVRINWPNLPCTGIGESMLDWQDRRLWVLLMIIGKWLRQEAKALKEDGIEYAVNL